MAEPATETESTTGAISNCTTTPSAGGTVEVAKPGAVTTRRESGVLGASRRNAPSGAAAVFASTPRRLTSETWAPEMGDPDGSTTVPLISAAERQVEEADEKKQRTGQRARERSTHSELLPRELN